MANSFLSKSMIGVAKVAPMPKTPKALKVTTPKFKSILKTASKTARVQDKFPAEVNMEERRLTGVSRRLLGAYQESPARFLPKSRSLTLQRMGGVR